MSQFGLSSTNSHWSYSSTGPYSPYLTSCTTPTASQFNNPSLGFTCTSGEQNSGQDFSASARDCVTMLPDSTAADLDQHLSNLVGATQQVTSHMVQTNIISAGEVVTSNSGNGSGNGTSGNGNGLTPQIPSHISNGLIVPRYAQSAGTNNHADAYGLTSSQSEPRSLSDSSQAESPVQDDLLTSNTPNLGTSGPSATNGAGGSGGVSGENGGGGAGGGGGGNGLHQNFSNIVMNQNNGGSNASTTPNYVGSNGTSSCNGSPLYPVLPASLLYSQLYTAANQSVGGFGHSVNHHHIQPPHGAVAAAAAVAVATGGSPMQNSASAAAATAAAAAMHAGELQSVMDHLTGSSQAAAVAAAAVSHRHHHHHHQAGANHLIGGHSHGTHSGGGGIHTHSDLSLIGNCSAMARGALDETNRVLGGAGVVGGRLSGPPGNSGQVGQAADNGSSVWRPY
uniref:Uncharacterized protein n=1 Tax=Anopheles christyi TaxID=43041 RepID=A0A182KG86_9DIPT